MQFCSQCGRPVSLQVPEGDNIPRYCCDSCGVIHYQNPRLVVGCVPEWEDRILICRRAIEPRLGYWTLPAGFMENGESTADAAARETLEEACADVEILEPVSMIDVPHIHQVHLLFRGRMRSGSHASGAESLDTRLVRPDEIPWQELAFPTIHFTLERYLADRERGQGFGFHRHRVEGLPW